MLRNGLNNSSPKYSIEFNANFTFLGEFLKQCKPFVEEGVHPRVIIRAFRRATNLVSFSIVLDYDFRIDIPFMKIATCL